MHILCTSIMERRPRASVAALNFSCIADKGHFPLPPSVARASAHFCTLKGEGRNFPSLAVPPSILPLHSVGNLVAMPRQQFGSTKVACFRIQEIRFVLKQAPAIRANEVLFPSSFQGYLNDRGMPIVKDLCRAFFFLLLGTPALPPDTDRPRPDLMAS